jgi:hypothetical protein
MAQAVARRTSLFSLRTDGNMARFFAKPRDQIVFGDAKRCFDND